MDERKAQETIRDAVRDSLAWLDGLPSAENEILEKTEKEERILMTAISPAARKPGSRRWKPVLAFCAAAVLFAGVWAVFRNGSLFNRINSPDVVSEPAVSESVTASPDPESLPAAFADRKTQMPLERIDLYADPDALWNEDNGILAEGKQIDKSHQLPFRYAVYRMACDNNVSTEGELVFRSESGAVLFRDRIRLQMDGDDYYAMDMPQKALRVEALDGAFEYPVFIDRTAISYPSLVLRNSGADCLFTRVADGVQNRLVEKYTDAHLLTLAWQPVHVYLNDEYWGIYNMREGLDARTVCRYEQIPEAEAANVTLLYIAGGAVQGNSQEYKALRKEMKDRDPASNPEDLEYLEQEVDIESFLDWLAVEMYFGNSDIGNGMVYRVPGGKWKCLLQDLDYGLFMSSYESVNGYLKPEGMGQMKVDNTIFRKILETDRYRDLFLTKLGDVYKALTTEVMQAELDECVAWIEPGMKAHMERWAPYNDRRIIAEIPTDPEQAWDYWKKRIDRMKYTMDKRPGCLYEQVQAFFGLTEEEMAHYFR